MDDENKGEIGRMLDKYQRVPTDELVRRALAGESIDPTKLRYPKIILDTPGWQPETTQGTPVPRLVNTDLPENIRLTRDPAPSEPLGWHYVTIPEDDE